MRLNFLILFQLNYFFNEISEPYLKHLPVYQFRSLHFLDQIGMNHIFHHCHYQIKSQQER